MADILRDIVAQNRAGQAVAIPSICTAHPQVIRACLARAKTLGQPLVVEATSNQVNQFGGYTSMKPADFVKSITAICDEIGLDRLQIVFGGDHLGPQVWRAENAVAAMQKSHDLVTGYVRAGFTKIHLDCSQGCLGEAAMADNDTSADRAVLLAKTCVDCARDPGSLIFVIGTEVPPPGGALLDEAGAISATTARSAENTLAAHQDAFDKAGLADRFAQVAGLVLQPGVEFSPMAVHHYPIGRELPYLELLQDWPGICLEAHSTDYQHPQVFHRLAAQGFAFQKVGPALTFAFRQALYSLDILRGLLSGGEHLLWHTMEDLMLSDPGHWQAHYSGSAQDLRLARHFGLADRIRYYWPQPAALAAVQQLKHDLQVVSLPDPVLLQVFDANVLDRAEMLAGSLPDRLIDAQVQLAIDPYFLARTANERA